ncbi:MAG: hypothetical protein WCD53_04575 [Microcoleus sp.]
MKVVAALEARTASKLSFYKEDSMRNMTTRQAISAIVALPLLLLANTTEAWANIGGQKVDPIKKVSNLGDRLDFDMTASTSINIEESEDWDEPDFSANLDMQITKFMTESVPAEIDELPPILNQSVARDNSTRACRISVICE